MERLLLIHRDGDFMTPSERTQWADRYRQEGVDVWITNGADVESYFCSPNYIAALYGLTELEAKEVVQKAIDLCDGAEKKFREKRKVILRQLNEDGGAPATSTLWKEGKGTIATVHGKALEGQLKNVLKQVGKNEKLLNKLFIPEGVELASELKILLESMINPSNDSPVEK